MRQVLDHPPGQLLLISQAIARANARAALDQLNITLLCAAAANGSKQAHEACTQMQADLIAVAQGGNAAEAAHTPDSRRRNRRLVASNFATRT